MRMMLGGGRSGCDCWWTISRPPTIEAALSSRRAVAPPPPLGWQAAPVTAAADTAPFTISSRCESSWRHVTCPADTGGGRSVSPRLRTSTAAVSGGGADTAARSACPPPPSVSDASKSISGGSTEAGVAGWVLAAD